MGALFRTEPIYDKLLDDMLEEAHKERPVEQFITKVRVTDKGHAAGRSLRDVLWPHGALVVKILRGEEEISPDGNTKIHEGDILVVRGKTAEKEDFLESLIKTVGEPVEEEESGDTPPTQEEIKG